MMVIFVVVGFVGCWLCFGGLFVVEYDDIMLLLIVDLVSSIKFFVDV